jgi:site-specific DNA recombinase
MIAAIYARKSTEQAGIVDEERSVTRQVEHAQAYVTRKGWTVDEACVFADDGISGAEFVKRPGLARLMNALRPRPPFQVLVMSEGSRLGREQIQTAYLLQQILDAGVRVFYYLEDRECTLDSAIDKVLLSLSTFAAETEREKASQRTYDAMVHKAKAGQVTGGIVYGYDNEEVRSPEGKRVHVRRRVNPIQAAIVRRIFEMYAHGAGMFTIASELNAEGVRPPRARGWAVSGIREMLHRELYQGVIVWNRSQKVTRGGTKRQRTRPETDWLRIDAPELRIVPPDVWHMVGARLKRTKVLYPRRNDGRLHGRPDHPDESKYLLTGFAKCAVCGGAMGTITRLHGTAPRRSPVHFYGCTIHHRRGSAVCSNGLVLRQSVVDEAILGAIAELLDPPILGAAIDKALERRRAELPSLDCRPEIQRKLRLVQERIDRALDALLDGGPRNELNARIEAEKIRRAALTDELARLDQQAAITDHDPAKLQQLLWECLAEVDKIFHKGTPQVRQMLRALLADKIEMEPVDDGVRRGYLCRGVLTIDALLASARITSLTVVAPTGFEPVFQP